LWLVQDMFFEPRPELMPLGKLLPWVGSAVTRRFARAAAEHGLTPTSMGVLGLLGHRDGVSHRELAAHLGLTPGTLTPVVDALEAAGELRRARDLADRRVVRLFITDRGRERLQTAFAQVAVTMRNALPQPSPDEAEIIRKYLLAVLAATGAEEGVEP
jgi:DNA-binding MarR family transcriptional regulator